MSTGELPGILRKPGAPQYSTFVELFFDLVYIFVFTRLSQALLDDLTVRGAVRITIVLLAVWWVWVLTAWLTDLFDTQLPVIQWLVIVVMVGTLLMGTTVPQAFEGRGLIFVLAYFGIHLARDVVLIRGTRVNREVQARSVRVAFWLGVTAAPWLAGAFVHGSARLALWAFAVTVDLLSARFGWPTPWLGRTHLDSPIFTGAHLSERHRQIVIVAFGELVVSSGIGLTQARFTMTELAVFGIAFGSAVLLFQLYFAQIRRLFSPDATRWAERVGPGTFTSYWHLLMVAGVVVIAVGDRSLVGHLYGRTPPAVALVFVGGPALFLIGSCLFDRVATGTIPWLRAAAVLVLFALTPVVLPLAPVLAAMVADGVLLLVLLVEIAVRRVRRRGRS